ncbi:MAG: phosphatidylglycerophosphatase A [Magnetococcales bacterium]|nr:phosphatidylglycerophosphatase A [Magnetococcales bacterium]
MPPPAKCPLALFIATFGGVGRLPKAPGTFGTLAAIPLAWLLGQTSAMVYGVALTGLILLGWWAADRAALCLGSKDPGAVVIDEVAGYCLTVCWFPPEAATLLAGFVLFRLFDIFKPWPVGWLDRNLSGGTGIMMDDLAAGLWSAALLALWLTPALTHAFRTGVFQ